tara:strand:+ start:245 stop:580 length:336 start_codon:yes stop_codon:yes gene_type:complete
MKLYQTFLFAFYFIFLLFQFYYILKNNPNILEIFLMVVIDTYLIVILLTDYYNFHVKKENSEYVSFGNNAEDAILGIKYNYDLIVDKNNDGYSSKKSTFYDSIDNQVGRNY